MELLRPDNLWEQVMNDLRHRIDEGEYAPGARLPSEAKMIASYKVSRTVVRQAIAALRAEGVLTVHQGKGAWVRELPSSEAVLVRRITRTGTGANAVYAEPDSYTEAEEPTLYRSVTDAVTAPMLAVGEGEAVFAADRLLTHDRSGRRVLHRTVLPFATADGTGLEQDPHRAPADLYTALAAAGHALSWTEQTTARMPTPDEATALGLPEGVPILIVRRITHGADRPLLLEETRAGADALHTEHRVTADTSRRPVQAV